MNEVFPEYKDSESYIPELLLERVRVLEKKDQENQKVIDTMMNTLETMMSTIERREKADNCYLKQYNTYIVSH